MAKSLRSKWKRKMKAIKRVRYGEKEKAVLEKMLDQAKSSGALKTAQDIKDDAMDTTAKSDHNPNTFKNQHGNYPKWMSKRKVEKIKKIDNKKKAAKKKNQKKSKVMGLITTEDEPELNAFSSESESNKFRILSSTDQIKELQTIIRDKDTNRSDFKFVADRLIRMVIEEGLNQLPYQDCEVVTPTGCTYSGHKFEKGNCGVSIVRSGEAMEKALQECCRSMRIGKVLVDSDSETHEAHVVFAKFPDDIATRKVLLLYPIMRSGNKVCKAVQVLKEHNVPEEHVILINLFCTPMARDRIVQQFPDMKVLTTELHPVTPNHFGQKYFGTDYNASLLLTGINLQMAYALYRGTRVGLALQEALGELEEYEQISPSVKSAVLRKFDETICDKLENEVDTRLTVRAERLWSFRFCDSVWQLLLKNVEFLTSTGQPVVKVDGKVKIVACDARKLDDRR